MGGYTRHRIAHRRSHLHDAARIGRHRATFSAPAQVRKIVTLPTREHRRDTHNYHTLVLRMPIARAVRWKHIASCRTTSDSDVGKSRPCFIHGQL